MPSKLSLSRSQWTTNFDVFSVLGQNEHRLSISLHLVDFTQLSDSVSKMGTLVAGYFSLKYLGNGSRHSLDGSKIQRIHLKTPNVSGPLTDLSENTQVHTNIHEFLSLHLTNVLSIQTLKLDWR